MHIVTSLLVSHDQGSEKHMLKWSGAGRLRSYWGHDPPSTPPHRWRAHTPEQADRLRQRRSSSRHCHPSVAGVPRPPGPGD